MERYVCLFVLIIVMVFGINSTAMASDIPFDWHAPFMYGEIYDGGGSGSYYNQGFHVGSSRYCIDFNQSGGDYDEGRPVVAIADGTVVAVTGGQGYNSVYPDDVSILHEDGYYSLYMHLYSNAVSVGEEVRQGQVIGYIGGQTGYSPHLHFCIFNAENLSLRPSPMDGTYYEDSSDMGNDVTSTNSAVFDNRDTTALTDTNPYSHSTNWLGNTEGNIHWWDGQDYDETNAPDSLSNGYANTLYIQDFDGAYCDSTVSYDSGVNDGAIVYDALGGGRSAYIVQCEQWLEWISTDAPYVGPESSLGNPVTNVYQMGHGFYQLFQGGYIRVRTNGRTVHSAYPNGFAPGELQNGSWDPQISYRFAEEYERRGAHKRWGFPTDGVVSIGTSGTYYAQYYQKRQKALVLNLETQSFAVTSQATYNSLVNGSTSPSSVTTSNDVETGDNLDQDGDGFTPDDGDCDDTYFYVNPDHVEWLDGIDNDCDGAVDNDLPSLVGSAYSSQDVSSLVPVAYIDSYSDVQTYSNPFTGQVHAVFGGDDGDVYEITLTDGTWSVIDLSAHIWVPYILTGTQPFGFVNEVSGMRYVVFTAETGDIWMFSVSPDNDIDVVDLSAHIWVPYATSESDPMGYADPTTGDIHVVFTGNDGYPWHIRLDGTTGGYSSSVLSAGVGIYYGTNAYPFMDPLIGDHYVLYTGSNGRVYLMVSGDGISYGAFDVSGAAPVAYSNSTPMGLVDPITEEFYVYLLGDNERLYEVHYNLSTWASRDLSALTPVPYMEPGTTPIATVNPFTGEHLISVLGDNRRVTLFTTTNTTVNSVDLTGQASVTYTETGTAPWVMIDPEAGVTHVLFTGDNFRVQYLRYGP